LLLLLDDLDHVIAGDGVAVIPLLYGKPQLSCAAPKTLRPESIA
jgi:hypothetical protein